MKGGLRNERMKILFENMAQYIFERLGSANLSEDEIKNIFTKMIGFFMCIDNICETEN